MKRKYLDSLTDFPLRNLLRGVSTGVSGGGVVSDILFWLTNVRNLLTTKGSGPAVFDRGDSAVTLPAFDATTGLALVTTPINVIGSPGTRISYDTDEGATLGADLVVLQDASKWAAFGSNVVSDDGSEVKITYVDSSAGALYTLSSSAGRLSENLTPGSTYTLTGLARVSSSASVEIIEVTFGAIATITSETQVPFSHTFVATAGNAIRTNQLGSGEIIWFSDLVLKEVTPAWLNSVSSADATLLTPVKTVEGAGVYINMNKWANATLYAAGSYVTDFDGVQNKYYLTALGGTSNGTGVADDIGVTDWVEQGNYSNTNELPGIASNPAFTQYFVLPEAPANQTISLGTGNFTLFVWGSDGASVAANTATGTGFGAATLNNPITINITGAGTVDVTVTGTPLFVGLHNTEFTAVSVLNPTTTVAVAASTETNPQVFSTQFIRCRATGGLYAETLYSDGTNVLAWDGTDLTFTDGVATLTAAAVVLVPNDDIVVDTTDGKLYVNGVLKDTDGTLAVTWGAITIIGNISDLAESSSFDPTDQTWKNL